MIRSFTFRLLQSDNRSYIYDSLLYSFLLTDVGILGVVGVDGVTGAAVVKAFFCGAVGVLP